VGFCDSDNELLVYIIAGALSEKTLPYVPHNSLTDYLFSFLYLDIINNIYKMFTLGKCINFVITK
jgi:hypothetical protein